MALNEDHLDIGNQPDRSRRNPRLALNPLHEAAVRLADFGLNRSRSRTKDLMNLLICHGARAWRYSQPEARIHLHVGKQSGRYPVVIRLR